MNTRPLQFHPTGAITIQHALHRERYMHIERVREDNNELVYAQLRHRVLATGLAALEASAFGERSLIHYTVRQARIREGPAVIT